MSSKPRSLTKRSCLKQESSSSLNDFLDSSNPLGTSSHDNSSSSKQRRQLRRSHSTGVGDTASLLSQLHVSSPFLTTTKTTVTKSLCWGELIIYEFRNILGDHPSVGDGPPLTIAWKPFRRETINIDYYEYLQRKQQPQGRRSRKELFVDGGTRGKLLLKMGYSLEEIVKAVEEVEAIKESRRSNMIGRFDSFKAVFQQTRSHMAFHHPNKDRKPRIMASKMA